MRILSLLPSATEIVHALGAGRELVGRSAECDHPADVVRLPVVMRARTLDAELPSDAIDLRVQTARRAGESLYSLDLDALRALRPDVILSQDLCGVCSVTDEEVRAACTSAGIGPRIVSLSPRTLEEVWTSIEVVGRSIGRSDAGASLAAQLRAKSRPTRPAPSPAPRVAVLEWLDPPILAGLWTPDIVARAGGLYRGPMSGAVGERTDWTDLARRAPDLTIVAPCSFHVDRTRAELLRLRARPEVAHFLAQGRIVVADEAYFSRPGPRLGDGVALVARLVRGGSPEGPMAAERWVPAPAGAAA